MSLLSNSGLLVQLLHRHRAHRRRTEPTAHERNVAVMEAAHILHLAPVPESFLPLSSLTPSSPLPPILFSASVHQDLLANELAFFDATHLSITEFTLLHAHVHHRFLTSRSHSNSTSPHVLPMPTELGTSDQLLLWLFYLLGDRNAQLSLQFQHLHRTTIYHIVDHVTLCMNEALDDMIAWPSSDERQLLHGRMSVCSGAVAVLDGTHCPIQAPTHFNYTYYSGYKCKHTQNYLVCVNVLGMVLYIDGPHVGRKNDREDYKNSDLFNNSGSYLDRDE